MRTKRRWYQFSLRTWFVAIAAAIGLGVFFGSPVVRWPTRERYVVFFQPKAIFHNVAAYDYGGRFVFQVWPIGWEIPFAVGWDETHGPTLQYPRANHGVCLWEPWAEKRPGEEMLSATGISDLEADWIDVRWGGE